MTAYWTLPGFADVYLEDSWVSMIRAELGTLTIGIDLVLRASHPAYHPAEPGEQYAYARGTIEFAKVVDLSWTDQGRVRPAIDAMGERDYGTLDEFEHELDHYLLSGDFGRITLVSAEPKLNIVNS